MKNTFLYLFLILLIVACTEKNNSQQVNDIKTIATPIQLNSINSKIVLSDYFLYPEKIDSFQKSKYYSISRAETNSIIIHLDKSAPLIFNIAAYIEDRKYDIPVFKDIKKTIKIEFSDPQKSQKNVQIKGQMTNWLLHDMAYKDGVWSKSFQVFPGKFQYLFVVDGTEMLDKSNPITISNGMGGFNSLKDASINENNLPKIRLINYNNNVLSLTSKSTDLNILVYLSNELLDSNLIHTENEQININLQNFDRDIESIRIYAHNDFAKSNDILIPLKNGTIISDSDNLSRNNWQSNIYYFLLVDRFYDGNLSNTEKVEDPSIHPKANYYGGDLQGVIDKLKEGYFKNLGVNALWLSPITQNPNTAYGLWPEPKTTFSAYHGYWPVSSSQIDHRFGTEDNLHELISLAHSQDINVIIDYVANHVHEDHPVYKQHPDWATNLYLPDGSLNTEKWDEHRLTTWFDTFLPTLDFSKSEVISAMSDSAMHWMTHYDLDGFRHDATKHIQLEFWRTLTKKIKKDVEKPIFQIGETYGSPNLIKSYINSGMLDCQFDFNLYDAAVNAYASPSSSLEDLASVLTQSLDFYGSHHLMGNISGNQDRARFITYASGDLQFSESAKAAGWTRKIELTDSMAYNKLAMLHGFNMTIPGIPMIYYGDEYGAIGAGDPDNRRMMKFDNLNSKESELKELVTKLIHLRKENLALTFGDLVVEKVSTDLLIYSRQYLDNKIYIVFNKSLSPLKLDIPILNYTSLLGNTNNSIIASNSFDILKR